jgi:hypothetical protein
MMKDDAESVGPYLSKVLSQHGHGFHYAVLKRVAELREARRSRWILSVDEFPVEVGGDVTHVEFVLKAEPGRTYLVAECKKADPARARWCFTPAPYTWFGAHGDEIIIQEINVVSDVGYKILPRVARTTLGSYRLGLELKTGNTGDGVGKGEAINSAAAQVLRGTNGIIRHLFGPRAGQFFARGPIWFLPVIFTTAELWVSSTNLSEADLHTGRVSVTDARKVGWLWFSHNQSPALGHGLWNDVGVRDLATDLQRESTRSIAIVSVTGIDQFLLAEIESFFEEGRPG